MCVYTYILYVLCTRNATYYVYCACYIRTVYIMRLTSMMYIAHVTTAAGDHVLKIGVVQPEERIDVY